ncbi:DNA translocase FtsK [Virgibacillus sp. 179-BFC.A HS]|uniref:DNA translocase FtsK n=1 Tax=Tigheibacillus jepli TaxID=3035914 RepID=A0ABU5CG53_9BACI|nr:DNA translocase FtsK [Virgibacillus sp. 179-BFC.A HS]MDY0405307.1 DNA translocase FtsK [Virgibacillus sp. 179-BFC.A HS]
MIKCLPSCEHETVASIQRQDDLQHQQAAATVENALPEKAYKKAEQEEQDTAVKSHEVYSLLRTDMKTDEKEKTKPANQEGLTKQPKLEPIIPLDNDRKKSMAKEVQKKKPMMDSKHQQVPFNVLMNDQDKRNFQLRNLQKENRKVVSYTKDATSIANKRRAFVEPNQIENKKTEQTRTSVSSQTVETAMPADDDHQLHLPIHLLDDTMEEDRMDNSWVSTQQELLEQTLKYFNVRAKVVNATQGPSVTRFEVQPELGVKVSKVKNLSDDLKLNMSARDIRIEAPIPGKNTIGIEVPNQTSRMVGLQEIVATDDFKESKSPLTVALGLNIEGTPIMTNIQQMPHGLIAGATGSGKSVCINTILVSLLYKANHEDVKFLLIDPKMVELAAYNGIPHLISPVITDVKAATAALKWAVGEMESRYDRFVQEGVRDIKRYNQRMKTQHREEEKMPFIVIVIDELADLMMVAPNDVEDAICRIAQKARACGIHLLLATQRPSVDVLTGLIKANIPRIAFSVSSQVDSRTILDSAGAEKLLGKGDMLFVENGSGKSVRLQGPFVSDDEIERVTNYVRTIAPTNYLFEQESLLEKFNFEEEEDDLLSEAISFVVENHGASTSLLQRHFKIGYNRAARLIDSMESKGIISAQNGSKQREILVTSSQLDELLL